jgi:hypothetical protein
VRVGDLVQLCLELRGTNEVEPLGIIVDERKRETKHLYMYQRDEIYFMEYKVLVATDGSLRWFAGHALDIISGEKR